MTRTIRATFMTLAMLMPALVAADVPLATNYQGVLLDSEGTPRNGSADIVIRIFNDPVATTAGALVYEEAHLNVPLTDGRFDIQIGDGRFPSGPFDESVFEEAGRWLEVEADGETLAPRQPLLSTPFAFRSQVADSAAFAEFAGDADTLDGFDAADLDGSGLVADHAAIPDDHHTKTASFSELGDVIDDAQIPDGITRDSELAGEALARGTGDTVLSGQIGDVAVEVAALEGVVDLLADDSHTIAEALDAAEPVYQKRYAQVLVVDWQGNGDFTDPVAALASIDDASATNPYLVQILPGDYALSDTLMMSSFVDVAGAGRNSTILQGQVFFPVPLSELRSLSVEHDDDALVFGTGSAVTSVRDVSVVASSDSASVTAVTFLGISATFDNVSITATGSGGSADVGMLINAPVSPLSLDLRRVHISSDTALSLLSRSTNIPSGPLRIVDSRLSGSLGSINLAPPLPGGSQVAWQVYVIRTGLLGDVSNASSAGCSGNPGIPCFNNLRCVGAHSESSLDPLDASCRETTQWVLEDDSGKPALQTVQGDAVALVAGATTHVTASCPGGWLAISGGWERGIYHGELNVTRNQASTSTAPSTAWTVELQNKSGVTLYPSAVVTCARFRRLLNH